MKRIFLTFCICLLSSMLVFAQEDHLKFMGIPLDGSIDNFEKELLAKGLSLYSDFNSEYEKTNDCRAFEGKFSGENAILFIEYDPSNKIVYAARVFIECVNEITRDKKYDYFNSMLSIKYPEAKIEMGEQEGHEAKAIFIPNKNHSSHQYLGFITIACSNDRYMLEIDYTDTDNMVKCKKKNLDDL